MDVHGAGREEVLVPSPNVRGVLDRLGGGVRKEMAPANLPDMPHELLPSRLAARNNRKRVNGHRTAHPPVAAATAAGGDRQCIDSSFNVFVEPQAQGWALSRWAKLYRGEAGFWAPVQASRWSLGLSRGAALSHSICAPTCPPLGRPGGACCLAPHGARSVPRRHIVAGCHCGTEAEHEGSVRLPPPFEGDCCGEVPAARGAEPEAARRTGHTAPRAYCAHLLATPRLTDHAAAQPDAGFARSGAGLAQRPPRAMGPRGAGASRGATPGSRARARAIRAPHTCAQTCPRAGRPSPRPVGPARRSRCALLGTRSSANSAPFKSHVNVDSQFYHTAFRGPPKGRNAPTMLARILPARGVFAGARAAAACHARRAHTQASGGASDQAVTIQKMSTEQWAEAFKKVRPSLFPRVPLVAAARLRDGPANTPPIPFPQPRPRPAAVGVGVWVACWSCPLRC